MKEAGADQISIEILNEAMVKVNEFFNANEFINPQLFSSEEPPDKW